MNKENEPMKNEKILLLGLFLYAGAAIVSLAALFYGMYLGHKGEYQMATYYLLVSLVLKPDSVRSKK